jgi:hypothetical protein
MSARAGDFESAFRILLPAHFRKIHAVFIFPAF